MKMAKLKILATSFLVIPFTVACGSSKTTKSVGEFSSSSTDSSSKVVATCSADPAGLTDFSATLTAFSDAFGNINMRFVRLKITKLTTDFDSNKWDLMLYRWTASPTGSTSLDPKPLFFHPERKTSNGFQKLIQSRHEGLNGYQVLNYDEIKQLGMYANINAASAQIFLQTVDFLVDLNDETGNYKVLRVALKDSGGNEMKKLDILIPPFYANPLVYRQPGDPSSRKADVLFNLHPLTSNLGQGWTDEQYLGFTKNFCI